MTPKEPWPVFLRQVSRQARQIPCAPALAHTHRHQSSDTNVPIFSSTSYLSPVSDMLTLGMGGGRSVRQLFSSIVVVVIHKVSFAGDILLLLVFSPRLERVLICRNKGCHVGIDGDSLYKIHGAWCMRAAPVNRLADAIATMLLHRHWIPERAVAPLFASAGVLAIVHLGIRTNISPSMEGFFFFFRLLSIIDNHRSPSYGVLVVG
jgi:hypothetical protein